MWRVYKAAGRPWPEIVPDDPVLDYYVMEAVYLKVQQEDAHNRKVQARKDAQRAAMQELAQTHG